MIVQVIRFFVVLQCLMTCVTASLETTCDVPTASEGEAVNLTCHFSTNITSRYINFIVMKTGFGDIVDFSWLNATHPKVATEPGFNLYNNTGWTATVGFYARPDLTGDYACAEETQNAFSRRCTFKLKENATVDKKENLPTEIPCKPHWFDIAAPILSAVIVLLVMAQIASKYFHFPKRLYRSKDKGRKENGHPLPSSTPPTVNPSDEESLQCLLKPERQTDVSNSPEGWEPPKDKKTFDDMVDERVKIRTDELRKQMLELTRNLEQGILKCFEIANSGPSSEENPSGISAESTNTTKGKKELRKPASHKRC